MSVAKKAETKVKLSDKSPDSHEKKNHISQCYNDMHTCIHKLYLNTNLSVAKKANVFVLRVIGTNSNKNIKFTCQSNKTLFKYKIK